MSDNVNRRKVLSKSAAAISGGVLIGSQSVSASDCQEPDWLEDGSVGDYDEEVLSDSEDLESGWVNSTLYMYPMYTNGDGNQLFHFGAAVCGYDECPDGNYEAYIKGHGTKISVSEGSLYANQDPSRTCAWPDTAGPSQETNVPANLAFTTIKGAVGLINPTVGAGILAADLVTTAVFAEGNSDSLNNEFYYTWGHTNGDPLSTIRHNMVGHYVDFFIMPESNPVVKFGIHHYVNSHERNIYDSVYNPSFEVEEEYSAYEATGQMVPQSTESTPLSEEEIEYFGLPEEFVQGGEVYRHSTDKASMENTS